MGGVVDVSRLPGGGHDWHAVWLRPAEIAGAILVRVASVPFGPGRPVGRLASVPGPE